MRGRLLSAALLAPSSSVVIVFIAATHRIRNRNADHHIGPLREFVKGVASYQGTLPRVGAADIGSSGNVAGASKRSRLAVPIVRRGATAHGVCLLQRNRRTALRRGATAHGVCLLQRNRWRTALRRGATARGVCLL